MGYVDAFKKYGATLVNPQWSVSAFAGDGSLVLSLWQSYLKRGQTKGALEYRDSLSKWKGNASGCAYLKEHLKTACAAAVPVKLVIAHPATLADAALVGNVPDESKINKTFSVREDLVGTIESFDGDNVLIIFRAS